MSTWSLKGRSQKFIIEFKVSTDKEVFKVTYY